MHALFRLLERHGKSARSPTPLTFTTTIARLANQRLSLWIKLLVLLFSLDLHHFQFVVWFFLHRWEVPAEVLKATGVSAASAVSGFYQAPYACGELETEDLSDSVHCAALNRPIGLKPVIPPLEKPITTTERRWRLDGQDPLSDLPALKWPNVLTIAVLAPPHSQSMRSKPVENPNIQVVQKTKKPKEKQSKLVSMDCVTFSEVVVTTTSSVLFAQSIWDT